MCCLEPGCLQRQLGCLGRRSQFSKEGSFHCAAGDRSCRNIAAPVLSTDAEVPEHRHSTASPDIYERMKKGVSSVGVVNILCFFLRKSLKCAAGHGALTLLLNQTFVA